MWAIFAVYQLLCRQPGSGRAACGQPPEKISFPHALRLDGYPWRLSPLSRHISRLPLLLEFLAPGTFHPRPPGPGQPPAGPRNPRLPSLIPAPKRHQRHPENSVPPAQPPSMITNVKAIVSVRAWLRYSCITAVAEAHLRAGR